MYSLKSKIFTIFTIDLRLTHLKEHKYSLVNLITLTVACMSVYTEYT